MKIKDFEKTLDMIIKDFESFSDNKNFDYDKILEIYQSDCVEHFRTQLLNEKKYELNKLIDYYYFGIKEDVDSSTLDECLYLINKKYFCTLIKKMKVLKEGLLVNILLNCDLSDDEELKLINYSYSNCGEHSYTHKKILKAILYSYNTSFALYIALNCNYSSLTSDLIDKFNSADDSIINELKKCIKDIDYDNCKEYFALANSAGIEQYQMSKELMNNPLLSPEIIDIVASATSKKACKYCIEIINSEYSKAKKDYDPDYIAYLLEVIKGVSAAKCESKKADDRYNYILNNISLFKIFGNPKEVIIYVLSTQNDRVLHFVELFNQALQETKLNKKIDARVFVEILKDLENNNYKNLENKIKTIMNNYTYIPKTHISSIKKEDQFIESLKHILSSDVIYDSLENVYKDDVVFAKKAVEEYKTTYNDIDGTKLNLNMKTMVISKKKFI